MTTIAVIGAGQRGRAYADIARGLGARVVAVADPDPVARDGLAAGHGCDHIFTDWRDLLAEERLADAVFICTQDQDHVEPTIVAAERGYHILVEKPMATDEAGALKMAEAVKKAGVISGVCHVLRYTAYTQKVKELIDAGAIGTVATIQHLEPVGWWHFAHSFVRGNWRSERASSPMLVAKAVHDVDWVMYVMGEPVRQVSSFGTLLEFRPDKRPEKAASRCLDCPVRFTCPYDAVRIYRNFLDDPVYSSWPLTVLSPDPTWENLEEALRSGPYGECVYLGYNDVVDHQVVSLEFASGSNASLVVTAFTEMANRKTRIFGTRGWLEGDGTRLTQYDFVSGISHTYDTGIQGSSAASGHGGGDTGLVKAFLDAVVHHDQSLITSDIPASLITLQATWAAEESRRLDCVCRLPQE